MFVRTVALGVGLVTAVATSQLPEFEQQYRQRLGGAVDELRRLVARYEQNARADGLTLPNLIETLRRNGEEIVRRQGDTIAYTVDRFQKLDAQYHELETAGPLRRIVAFLTDADTDLAKHTYEDFSPALPATIAGALSAIAGFLVGMSGVHGTSAVVRRIGRRRKSPFRPLANGAARKAPARSWWWQRSDR